MTYYWNSKAENPTCLEESWDTVYKRLLGLGFEPSGGFYPPASRLVHPYAHNGITLTLYAVGTGKVLHTVSIWEV